MRKTRKNTTTTSASVNQDEKIKSIKKRSTDNLENLNLNLSSSLPSFHCYQNQASGLLNSQQSNTAISSSHLGSIGLQPAPTPPLSPLPPTQTQLITVPVSIRANYMSMKLLEPIRPSGNSIETSAVKKEINNNSQDFKVNSSSCIRNSDLFSFDSASLDPFNDMELKTINEFEELKNILNTQQIQQAAVATAAAPSSINSSSSSNVLCDSFGLPNISFIDLDASSSRK